MDQTLLIKLPEDFPVKCVDCLKLFPKKEIKSFELLTKEYELYGDSLFAFTCRNCLLSQSPRRELYRFKINIAEFLYLLLYHLSFQSPTFTCFNQYRLFSIYTLLSMVEKYWDYYMFENKSNWRKRVVDCLLKDEYNCFILVTSYSSNKDDDTDYCDPWLCGLKDLNCTPKLLNSNIRELLQMYPDGLLLGKKRVISSTDGSNGSVLLVENVTTTTSTTSTSVNRMKRTKGSSSSNNNNRSTSTSSKKKSRSLKDKRPCTMLFLDIPNPLLGKKNDDGDELESPLLLSEPVRILNHLTHSAPQISISQPDGLVCWNPTRGYRMAKASHGVCEGCWYYECEIMELPYDKDSNCRLGFSQISGDLQAPCGYDQFSYGFRPQPATVFHQSVGKEYGTSILVDYKLAVGDVFGCMIYLPNLNKSVDENSNEAENLVVPSNHDKLPSPWNPTKPYDPVPYYGTRPQLKRSFVKFFVNGQDLGVAYEDLYLGKYHPAVSMFNGTKLKCNFGTLSIEGNFGLKYFQEARESCPEVKSFCELQLYKEF